MRAPSGLVSREGVRAHFGALTFPELLLAQRELGDMLADRLGDDPARAKQEIRELEVETTAGLRP